MPHKSLKKFPMKKENLNSTVFKKLNLLVKSLSQEDSGFNSKSYETLGEEEYHPVPNLSEHQGSARLPVGDSTVL